MFRKAVLSDVDAITAIYEAIHDGEEAGLTTIGWVRDVYPTRKTAEDSIDAGDLFVLEENGRIVASAKINQIQVEEYKDAVWSYDAPAEKVMVLHTLVVAPDAFGHGYGSQFVKFYEEYAAENDCPYLRMDTNERNTVARAMYKKQGYIEVGIVSCVFNGIEGVKLVCLEKTFEQ